MPEIRFGIVCYLHHLFPPGNMYCMTPLCLSLLVFWEKMQQIKHKDFDS